MWSQSKNRQPALKEQGLFLVLHLIGWDGSLIFLDQSQSEVKQSQRTLGLLLIIKWKLLFWNKKNYIFQTKRPKWIPVSDYSL